MLEHEGMARWLEGIPRVCAKSAAKLRWQSRLNAATSLSVEMAATKCSQPLPHSDLLVMASQ